MGDEAELRYSDEDVDRIVAKRLRESNAEAWARGINGALTKNTESIRELTALVKEHIALPMHPAQQAERDRLVAEFGLDHLTLEQRRAFPSVLAGAVNLQQRHAEEREASRQREAFWQRATAVAVVVGTGVSIFSAAGGITLISRLFHHA